METLTTNGIRISVDSYYQPAHSEPLRQRYLHVYNIRIENRNTFPVKLISRHWHITESTGQTRQVEGIGVINQQPVIEPGGFHAYSSYAIISSDLGRMQGTYTMQRRETGEEFTVSIPPFTLVLPAKLN